MGVPKRPNTAAATAAVVRRGHETMARKLRAAGWFVFPPREESGLSVEELAKRAGLELPREAEMVIAAEIADTMKGSARGARTMVRCDSCRFGYQPGELVNGKCEDCR